jgi:hypothetical protein
MGFLRVSARISQLLSSEQPTAYFTPDYLGVDTCGIPKVIVVHDTFRILTPAYGYQDSELMKLFDHAEVEELSRVAMLCGHGAQHGSKFANALCALQASAIRASFRVLTVSNATAKSVQRLYPEAGDKILVAPGGVDATLMGATACHRHYDDLSGSYYLQVVGDDRPHKRRQFVERAFAYSSAIASGAELLIVGSEFRSTPLTRGIRYVRSPDDNWLSMAYRNCESVIVGSAAEGFCLPAAEAITFGKRPLLPDLDVLMELYANYAEFYDHRSEDALAQCISINRRDHQTIRPSMTFSWNYAVDAFFDAIEAAEA